MLGLSEKVGFSKYETICDVRGATGTPQKRYRRAPSCAPVIDSEPSCVEASNSTADSSVFRRPDHHRELRDVRWIDGAFLFPRRSMTSQADDALEPRGAGNVSLGSPR